MPMGMGEVKKLDLYKMVNPIIIIGLFLTYLCSLSLITFQPTYIPYVNLFTKYNLKRKKSMLSGPYVVINQLINSIWKVAHLKNFLLDKLRGKKYQSKKKGPRLGLLKIRPKSSHSKVHSYLLVKVFIVIFFNPLFFPSCIMYWIPITNIERKS